MQQTAPAHVPLTTVGFAHPPRNALHFPVEPGMSVADFGAGSGHYVWLIAAEVGERGRVYVIDVQQDLLKRIHNEVNKRGFKNVKIIWADLEKPKASKLADQTVDIVLISNLLFQLEDKRAVFREAQRILKRGGALAVIDWAGSFNMMGPHKKDVVTKEAGAQLLSECGFKVDREFPAGAHHWGVIAREA